MTDKLKFQEKILSLGKLAKEKGNRLTTQEIKEFFAALQLDEKQLVLVYEYLAASKISVVGYVPPVREEEEKEEIPYTEEELNFLHIYENDLELLDMVSEEELRKLYAEVEKGDEIAKIRVTEQYLPVVLEMAKSLRGQGLTLDDLAQEGNIGLILSLEALGLRDEGVEADSYLKAEIRNAMEMAIEEYLSSRKADHQLVDKINYLSESIQKLTEELERQVSIEELSAYMDLPIEEIEDILKLAGDDIETSDEGSEKPDQPKEQQE